MRIAIIDDEQAYIDQLKTILVEKLTERRIGKLSVDTFLDGASFLAQWHHHTYDVIFLDIYMGEENGIDIARTIRQTDDHVVLVFCTTSNDFASQSYEVNARYYLTKPITEENFSGMLKRMDISRVTNNQSIELPDGTLVVLSRIRFTEYSNHAVTFYLDGDRKHTIYMSQKDVETLLTSHQDFEMINRGTIVNMNYIKSLDKSDLIMTDQTIIPVSRGRLKEFSQKYADFRFRQMID